jgi:hypothetical protein
LPSFILFDRLIGSGCLKLIFGINMNKTCSGSGKYFPVNVKPEGGWIKRADRNRRFAP